MLTDLLRMKTLKKYGEMIPSRIFGLEFMQRIHYQDLVKFLLKITIQKEIQLKKVALKLVIPWKLDNPALHLTVNI